MRALESDAQNEGSMQAEPFEPQITPDALVLTSKRSEVRGQRASKSLSWPGLQGSQAHSPKIVLAYLPSKLPHIVVRRLNSDTNTIDHSIRESRDEEPLRS